MTKNKYGLPEPKRVTKRTTGFTTKTGRLRKDLLPASYCDTSFLLDYWLSIELSPLPSYASNHEDEHFEIIRSQIKKHKHLKEIYKIRQKLDDHKNKTTPVYSTIALFEMAERVAETFFLSETLKATNIFTIQNFSKKEVGRIIQSLWKETQNITTKNNHSDDPLVNFTYAIFENMYSYRGDNLFGIVPVDFENITLRTPRDFNRLITLAAYQIGVADILHLVSADRLGCQYFITFDNDFVRARDEIEKLFGFKVLNNRQEILKII